MYQSSHNNRQFDTSWPRTGILENTERAGTSVFRRIEFIIACGVVFFSPINFLRLPFFYFTFSDALACLSLFMLLVQGRLSRQPIGPVSSLFWFLGLIMLLAGLLLSSMINGDAFRGIVFVLQYFFAYFVLLVVIAGRTERQLTIMAKAYLLAIVLMCLHGIYLIHYDGQTNTAFVSGNGRFTGFVERENECAAVIALSIPMLLLLCSVGKLPRIALLCFPLMGYGVMLTGSNTGLATFAFAVAVFTLLAFNWKLILGSGALLFAAVAAIDHWARDYLPAIFQRRVLGALETGNIEQAGTFEHRLELIYEAIDKANSTIFLGVGADQYAVFSFMEQPVHNLYLLLWTEGGLFCMIGFIVMIMAGIGPALKAWDKPGGRPYAACALSTVALFLITINAFASVYGRFWSVPVILAAALCYAYATRAERTG